MLSTLSIASFHFFAKTGPASANGGGGSGNSAEGGRGGLQLPPVTLGMEEVKKKFSEAEEGREMIVHEQLTAMQR